MSTPQNNLPKSSDGEINIITPENRTYTQPDYGFYPATIGFESDEIGSIPYGWTDLSGSPAFIDTYSSISGHNKVMRLVDTSGINQSKACSPSFAAQFFGTVDYWIYVEDATDGNFFALVDDGGLNRTFLFAIMGDYWQYFSDSTWKVMTELPTPKDNTWYHVSVHFECSSSKYMSLEQYSVRFEVEGVSSKVYAFENQLPYITNVLFCTVTNHYETFYVDSIGYSWDPAYSIGDNLNEGLLLSYDNTNSLDWQGYSLDSTSNKTIFGNTVIPFPIDGQHHIQVFGNDSFGNSYRSYLRYFSIDSSLPYISVQAPLQYSYFSNTAPTFQVTISGDNLNSIFYQIGDSKIFFGNNQGQINQNLWNGCDEGLVLITFYVNNTIGNYSVAEVTVYKDTILPSISTQFSYEGNSYDTPPYFFLSISDASLDLKWFTLNDDPTKHYLAGQNLGFASELWYSLYDGMITITIYATDKAGNENSYEFHVIKDVYGDYPNYPDPYIPSYYPSIIAVAIGGIMLLGIIVTIIIIFTNKNTQPRTRAMYFDQPSYRSPPIKTKQHEYSPSEVKIKCPYCSYEEDIDGNFCPRCGARLR